MQVRGPWRPPGFLFLRMARHIEPFTMLIAQLAYEGKGGPRLAYRFERFR